MLFMERNFILRRGLFPLTNPPKPIFLSNFVLIFKEYKTSLLINSLLKYR